MKTSLFLLVVVSLFAVSLASLTWQGTNDNGQPIVRRLAVIKAPPAYPRTVEIRAAQKDLNSDDVYVVDSLFSSAWLPRFVLRYFHKSNDSTEGSMARWAIWKLIEYNETSATDNGFQPSEDHIVSQHFFGRNWDPLVITRPSGDGPQVYSACSSYDPLVPGIYPNVTLCVHTCDRDARVNVDGMPTRLNPNALKWSLLISNYPYQSSSSRLALKVSFDSKHVERNLGSDEVPDADEGKHEGLELDIVGSVRTLAGWRRDVTLTGIGCPVNGTIVKSLVFQGQQTGDSDDIGTDQDQVNWGRTVRIMYYSIIPSDSSMCQPESIFWDPDFGVVTPADQSTTGSAPSSPTSDSGKIAPFLFLIVMLFVSLL